jgi:hypothetical protein
MRRVVVAAHAETRIQVLLSARPGDYAPVVVV